MELSRTGVSPETPEGLVPENRSLDQSLLVVEQWLSLAAASGRSCAREGSFSYQSLSGLATTDATTKQEQFGR
jgi:hypothetical protein